jgi:hypothetical protein
MAIRIRGKMAPNGEWLAFAPAAYRRFERAQRVLA